MALTATTLERLAGGGPVRTFIYQTADTAATVKAAGYFNAVRDNIRAGDIVFLSNGEAPSLVRIATVPASGNVTTL